MGRNRRWTAAELGAVAHRLSTGSLIDPEASSVRRSKFGNQSAVGHDGARYGSKLEARYANELLLQVKAGTVCWYTQQVPFRLEGGVIYRCDFLVVRNPLAVEIIDCKGAMTQSARNKMKQVRARFGFDVLIYRRDGSLIPWTEVPVTRRPPRP